MLSYFFTGLKNLINVGKKIFLVIAVFVAVISVFTYFINKDKTFIRQTEDPVKKNRTEIYKMINDKELNKSKAGKITIAIYKMTMCGLIGEACNNNPSDGDKNFPKSLFGKISGLIALPYANPPASGVMWAYAGLQSAGFVPKSYAAEGLGFATIKPYANLWKIFRDVAYLILVVILIAIGFMIMFRMKLNPQTVITVENAIPRIVVSLILITFSFAIAGFLIDLMYIIILIIISLLSNNNTYYNSSVFKNEVISATGWRLFSEAAGRKSFWDFIYSATAAILGIIPYEIQGTLKVASGVLSVFILNGLLHNNLIKYIADSLNNIHVGLQAVTFGGEASFGELPAGLLGVGLSFLTISVIYTLGATVLLPLIISALIFGTVIFLVFRIFFLLLNSYLKILFYVIISPVFLLFESLPGKSTFVSWLKNIIGNLLPFPLIVFVFILSYIILNTSLPLDTYDIRLPYLYGIDANSFKVFIGLGLIFMIPELNKMVKEALGIKELPVGLSLGTFFGGAGAVGGGAMGLLGQFSTFNLGMQGLRTLKGILPGKKGETPPPSDFAASGKQASTVGQSQALPISEGKTEG